MSKTTSKLKTQTLFRGRPKTGRLAKTRLRMERLEDRTLMNVATVLRDTPFSLPPQHELFNPTGFLTEPARGDAQAIARAYLYGHTADLGIRPADLKNTIVTRNYVSDVTGTTHLTLQQSLHGLPVANANLTINVTAAGQVINVGGGLVPNLSSLALSAPAPVLTPVQAVQAAANDLELGLRPQPQLIEAEGGPARVTTLTAAGASLDEVQTRLEYVATSQGGVVLTWNMALRTPDEQHWFNTDVDARTGALVSVIDWTASLVASSDRGVGQPGVVNISAQANGPRAPNAPATYNVYARPVESPSHGSRSLQVDPHDPVPSPFGWQTTRSSSGAEFTDTRGNNVDAAADYDRGRFRPDAGASLNFDFPIDLTKPPSDYRSAAMTNLFYWNNVLHDVHYRYGFTEAAGNFQANNYGRGGRDGDPVVASGQDSGGINNANFATPPDGSRPRMNMYLWNHTNPFRDGDLDTGIIVHEFGHGVSNRLTGNANGLREIQSRGMGEGWSDWWALMFTQRSANEPLTGRGLATYAIGDPTTGRGIRRFPYSFDRTIDPLSLGVYNVSQEVHNAGEIWCSALWDLNHLLIQKYGYDPDISHGYRGAGEKGNILALRLVMDALKLQPLNPSFLQARNAIIAADQVLTGGANYLDIWTVFARRGFGYSAVDGGSSSFRVTESFDLPPAGPIVVASTPSGDAFGQVSSVRFTFDVPINVSTFTPAKVAIFVGPSGPPISVTRVAVVSGSADKQFDVFFDPQRTLGNYMMVIGPDIRDTRGRQMDQNRNQIPGEIPGDQYVARFTIQGPKITATNLSTNPYFPGQISSFRVTFNQPMDPATFTPAKIPSFTGPRGSISVTTVAVVGGSDNRQFDITFPVQGTTGTYTMVIGPDIRDPFGHRMDQNGNFIDGEIPGDQFTARFSILGPRVTVSSPSGNNNLPGITSVRVTFNEPMNADTFTRDKIVSFTGPNGSISITDVTPVAGSSDTQFDIKFDTLRFTGRYRMVMGPDIRDRFGNQMDQNGNLIPGEVPDDQYTATFGILGPRVNSHTPSSNILGQVNTVRVTFNETIDATTFTADKIASFTGPSGPITVTGVFAVGGTSNTQFDITFAPQTQTGRYTMIVGPDIRDLYGNPMDQNQNLIPGEPGLPPAGDQYQATFGIQGPQILRHTIPSNLPGEVTSLRVTFNEAMDASTFTVDKIASFTGPGGVKLAVTEVDPVPFTGNTQFDVFFDPLLTSGNYTMVIGPDIRDLYGNPMDQNGNLIPGEIPGDQYRATFTVQSPRILSNSPSGTAHGPVDTVEVFFNEPMNPDTFSPADILSFAGPGGPINVTDVASVPGSGDTLFDITFDGQSALGNYTMVIGPNIQDVYGNRTGQEFTVRFTLTNSVILLMVGTRSTGWNDGTFAITQIATGQFATQSLGGFDALWVDSSNGSSSILLSRASDIAAFVNAGGGLVTDNVDDYRWVPNSVGLSFVSGFCGDDVRLTALGRAHPLATGLTDQGLSNWGCSWHTYFSTTAGMDVLATSTDTTRSLILAGSFGLGRLVYLGLDPTVHQPTGQTRQLIRQAAHWVAGDNPGPAAPTQGKHSLRLDKASALLIAEKVGERSSTTPFRLAPASDTGPSGLGTGRVMDRRDATAVDSLFAIANQETTFLSLGSRKSEVADWALASTWQDPFAGGGDLPLS